MEEKTVGREQGKTEERGKKGKKGKLAKQKQREVQTNTRMCQSSPLIHAEKDPELWRHKYIINQN